MNRQHQKAFTLIELLVVISIIALLLAILMPALGMVKEKAKGTVCKTNLHQWALCYQLYATDYNEQFPPYQGYSVSYMESLRDYYEDTNNMRTCPSATKMSRNNPTGLQPESFFGNTKSAWQIDPSAGWLPNDDWGIGSYTENSYIRTKFRDSWGSFTKLKNYYEVPLIADGRWHDSGVRHDVPTEPDPLVEEIFYNITNWSSIRTFMMRRHSDGINAAMADMSAVQIRVEDLWKLRWSKVFEKNENVDLPWLKKDL